MWYRITMNQPVADGAIGVLAPTKN